MSGMAGEPGLGSASGTPRAAVRSMKRVKVSATAESKYQGAGRPHDLRGRSDILFDALDGPWESWGCSSSTGRSDPIRHGRPSGRDGPRTNATRPYRMPTGTIRRADG